MAVCVMATEGSSGEIPEALHGFWSAETELETDSGDRESFRVRCDASVLLFPVRYPGNGLVGGTGSRPSI